MVLGAMMLVDGPIPELRVKLLTALAVSVPIGIIAVFLMTLVLRAHKNPVASGVEAMIGEIGIARTPRGAEAAMKTYLLGALFGITLLHATLAYGVGAATGRRRRLLFPVLAGAAAVESLGLRQLHSWWRLVALLTWLYSGSSQSAACPAPYTTRCTLPAESVASSSW